MMIVHAANAAERKTSSDMPLIYTVQVSTTAKNADFESSKRA